MIISGRDNLPKKKWNSPISRVVCWYCKEGSKTLKRLRNEKGVKTQDYACLEHVVMGLPPVGNSSRIMFKYKEEKRSNG